MLKTIKTNRMKNKKVIVVVLLAFLLLGIIPFNIVNANGTNYYFDKYNAIAKGNYSVSSWGPSYGFTRWGWNSTAHGSYRFDAFGKPEVYGNIHYLHSGNGYQVNGNKLTMIISNEYDMGEDYGELISIRFQDAIITGSTTYSKGTLVSSNIVAKEGTYPTYGRHIDGYWYVRGGKANTTSTITIDTPTKLQTINKDGAIIISGKITDPDMDTITVSATIGGKLKTANVIGPATNKVWTLSWAGSEVIDCNTDTVVITAKDSAGGLATATYTGKIVVDKTAPTVEITVK